MYFSIMYATIVKCTVDFLFLPGLEKFELKQKVNILCWPHVKSKDIQFVSLKKNLDENRNLVEITLIKNGYHVLILMSRI